LAIPAGANLWRVDLFGKVDDGSYTNVFFDEMNLRTVPIPAAVWMFGSALGVLGFAWSRKRGLA
jgi:hypothetical protein